ncbi:glycoside hydrolase family protein 32 [Klebsiella pneumoniae]|nr:glycoside hydrolase family protein 32 [Klebsiella pneumoniae]
MRPAKEVESLRGAWFPWPVSTLNNQQTTMVDNCEAMEVNLRWDCARSSAEQYGLRFGDGLRIYVDAQQQRLVLERHYPPVWPVRDAQRAVDRRSGSQPANIFR